MKGKDQEGELSVDRLMTRCEGDEKQCYPVTGLSHTIQLQGLNEG